MWPERSSWKEGGRKRDFSILAGRMHFSVKPARWRKAQESTGFTTVQNGTKSGVRFQRPSESGSKKRERRRKSGSGKRGIVTHPLSESQWTSGYFSMTKSESKKAQKLVHASGRLEGPCGHRRLLAGEDWESGELVVGQWYSWPMMKRRGPCLGCTAQWRRNLKSSKPSRGRS